MKLYNYYGRLTWNKCIVAKRLQAETITTVSLMAYNNSSKDRKILFLRIVSHAKKKKKKWIFKESESLSVYFFFVFCFLFGCERKELYNKSRAWNSITDPPKSIEYILHAKCGHLKRDTLVEISFQHTHTPTHTHTHTHTHPHTQPREYAYACMHTHANIRGWINQFVSWYAVLNWILVWIFSINNVRSMWSMNGN